MLKLVGVNGQGQPILLLGITGENVTRLVADEPILFDTGPLLAMCERLPAAVGQQHAGKWFAQVAIVYGKTETELLEKLRQVGARV